MARSEKKGGRSDSASPAAGGESADTATGDTTAAGAGGPAASAAALAGILRALTSELADAADEEAVERAARRAADAFAAAGAPAAWSAPLQAAVDGHRALANLAVRRAAEQRQQEAARHRHDEFLSLLAHDLRTPLTSIRGYAQLTMRHHPTDSGQDAALQANLHVIVEQADRLSLLTGVLLDVARIRTGRLALRRALVDLGQVVRQEAVALQQRPGGTDVELSLPEAGPVVYADSARAAQIVRTMLAFAAGRAAGRPVKVALAAEGGGAAVSVSDAGARLSPDEAAALFDQLVRLGEGGTGHLLGYPELYVLRGVVEAHGGRATASSPAPGEQTGVRLHVWLPSGGPGGPGNVGV